MTSFSILPLHFLDPQRHGDAGAEVGGNVLVAAAEAGGGKGMM